MGEEKKINILVIPSDHFGCGYWRSVHPHTYLAKKMGDRFNVDIIYEPPTDGRLEEFYKKYDIIHIHKTLDANLELIHFFQKCGCLVCVDVDDSPTLDKEHPMYISSQIEKWYIPIHKSLSAANFTTTTTPIFRDEIKQKFNKFCFNIPNAVPEGEGQFVLNKIKKTERIRFGIVCGSSHYHDILILKDMVDKMDSELLSKIQFVLCGFDVKGTTTQYLPPTEPGGKPIKKVKNTNPEDSIWNEFERILTKNYETISEEHKKWLLEYHANEDDPFLDEPYRRFWTKPIEEYYQSYSEVDVLMAPLFENHFNKMKSNLKFVEAANARIPVIATDFGPYSFDRTPVITKGGNVNPYGNCFLVETLKNKKGWLKTVKWITEHPEYVQIAGNNLYAAYRNKYFAQAVSEERARIYTDIVKNKEKYLK